MSDQSTTERIAALKKLAEAATPGPWDYDTIDTPIRIAGGEVVGGDCTGIGEIYTAYDCPNFSDEPDALPEPMVLARDVLLKDGRFIRAANPQAILSLIERIAELERQLASMAQGVRISIPTGTMEQEFQSHYRRGYEAGRTASHQKEDKA